VVAGAGILAGGAINVDVTAEVMVEQFIGAEPVSM
jgi:hypothetical protein